MSLTKDVYDALRSVITLDSRVEQLTHSVARVSERLDSYAERVTARIEDHAERLARLEGKFDLIQASLGAARRRRLTE